MVRARVFLSVVALLAWVYSGCLNPVTADAAAMDCCAGMDCSASEGAHDCCQTMTAAPQQALLASATQAAPVPAAVVSGITPQGIVRTRADFRFDGIDIPRSHAPPLYTLHASLLI